MSTSNRFKMGQHLMVAFLMLILLESIVEAVLNPEEFPNLLAGSFTDGNRLSTGNTLPLIGLPWGFNHWSPQTRDANRYTGSWWFSGSDHKLTWLRCTHQPSPWIGDWGYFYFIPQIGEVTRSPQYSWQPRGAYMKPYLFDATVAPVNLRMELTPTTHGAVLRVTFPATSDWGEKFVCFAGLQFKDHGISNTGQQYFSGVTFAVHSDRMLVNNFNFFVRAESQEAVSVQTHEDMQCFQYPREATVVHVRMATSLISPSQAQTNLQREMPPSKSFNEVLFESKAVWNRLMRRVNVIDPGEISDQSSRDLTVFYTGLYRALTFPRRIDEVDSQGNLVHYSPYDIHGRTFPGPLVTDNGFWDTYRTVYPLLSLIYPDQLGIIIQGWLNAYKEGGWLPSWASPGYRNCMVGTFADVVIADAIVKDVPGFDIRLAIDALSKDAFETAPGYAGGAVGKEGLGEYMNRGYLPLEMGGEIVSRTLDYGFADYSTALAFFYLSVKISEKLPSEADPAKLKEELMKKAKTLYQRAVAAFRSSFDSNRGFMVPKSRQGGFTSRFSPIEWGNGYTEGNAWHHSFPAYAILCPYLSINNDFISSLKSKNPELDQLLGCQQGLENLFNRKREGLLEKLHQLLSVQSRFQVGSYGQEIHEMTESITLAIGQYAHNNQPVHHIPYLFAVLGDPHTTQRLAREVMQRGYGVDFYAGDEDNGEQGAWFVLSALGLYSVAPGSVDYVISSPLFRHVRIAHPPRSVAKLAGGDQEGAEEEKVGEYLDLFAYDSLPSHSNSSSSSSHNTPTTAVRKKKEEEDYFVEKVTIDDSITVGAEQHFLVSDKVLQKNAIVRFHFEQSSSVSQTDFLAAYHDYTTTLHHTLTRDLESRYPSSSSSSESLSTATSNPNSNSHRDKASLLQKKLHQKEVEIEKLQHQLQSGHPSESMSATAASSTIFIILTIGFLVALMMAKVLDLCGCLETGGDTTSSGSRATFWYYYFQSIFRRGFLLLRSCYQRYLSRSNNNSPSNTNHTNNTTSNTSGSYYSQEETTGLSWSLKSQAHSV